jgi:hypothetical protein
MMRFLVLAGTLAVAASTPLATAAAQSVPNVSGVKQTTQRAVNKTNAHTLAMTNADSARAVESPAADTARGRGVRATAAGAATATRASSPADTAGKLVIRREVFAYEQSGRRDPFVSLMTVGELRPMISDLVVSGILIDPSGRGSVAVLRDVNTKEQYRVRVGQQLGRMRVARIAQKSVTFTIEEFGYSRQQELALEDSNQARTK